MNGSAAAFVFSVGAVVLAEMGDKTQLLAMAFAAKFSAARVMAGVFAATLANHALAVAAGNFVTRFESLQTWITAAAALSFIFFGLWTLRGDELAGEHERPSAFGPAMTVGVAFFIAEMGDKTQLATIAIATRFPAHPYATLAGTTTGMMIADGVGILVGIVLRKKIPERTVKIVSAVVFIAFGLFGTYDAARTALGMSAPASAAATAVIAAATALCSHKLLKAGRGGA